MEHISVGISEFMRELEERRFIKWCEDNIDELEIKWAETGADRELDFDIEQMLQEEYDKYLESMLPKEKKV
tara:strand:+ start:1155 stop:1367 length:213 start_codon:yes stop_codon:yes gene_type:complete